MPLFYQAMFLRHICGQLEVEGCERYVAHAGFIAKSGDGIAVPGVCLPALP